MPIHQATKKLIEKLEAGMEKDVGDLTAEELRELIDQGRPSSGKPESVAAVEEKTITGPNGNIPIRIYTPEGDGPFPALVYFPGSGFMYGSLDLADWLSRALANAGKCKVIAVGYRSAPEHKYPQGLNDAFAATKWVIENATNLAIDSNNIGVAGYSSGGNFACTYSYHGPRATA